jgi:hypothetical protein
MHEVDFSAISIVFSCSLLVLTTVPPSRAAWHLLTDFLPISLLFFSSFPPFLFSADPGAENPTYLKEPMDKVVLAIGVGGALVGVGNILAGLYSMGYGINKI